MVKMLHLISRRLAASRAYKGKHNKNSKSIPLDIQFVPVIEISNIPLDAKYHPNNIFFIAIYHSDDI